MVVKSRRLPVPGETVTGGQFVMVPGGKGANQAVAAARLGAEVTFVASVGDDLFGTQAVQGYGRDGIVTDHIRRDPELATGVALILVDEDGENLISVASGANHALSPDDVDAVQEQIAGANAVMLQLEVPLPLSSERLRSRPGLACPSFWIRLQFPTSPSRQLYSET